MTEETGLTTQSTTRELAIRETSISFPEIQSMGEAFYKSGMFTDIRSAAQAIVKIQAGKELGLGAVYAMQRLYMVEGKLGMAAETMGALLKRGGKYNYRVQEHTDQKCSIVFYENGKEAYVSTFTMADAKRASLVKPNGAWAKYPRALLFSRALSQGARIVAPDVIGGGYTLEELESIKSTTSELPDDAPIAEGQTVSLEGTVSPDGEIPETGKEIPDVGNDNPYAHFLETCPEHGESWFTNKFGKRCHKQDDGWCNLNDQIKPILKTRAEQAGFDAQQLNDWCKENYDGRTWSKLSEEEWCEVLLRLEQMRGKSNPVVDEAIKMGAVVTEKED